MIKSMQIMNEAGASPADVICWSGCLDTQTVSFIHVVFFRKADGQSADTFENGQAVGAMSYVSASCLNVTCRDQHQAFITSLTKDPSQTYMGLLTSIRALLKERYTQTVQLTSCHRELGTQSQLKSAIDTHLEFVA